MINAYLACQQMYDFERVLYNTDSQKFLSVVSSVHHQGINQSEIAYVVNLKKRLLRHIKQQVKYIQIS